MSSIRRRLSSGGGGTHLISFMLKFEGTTNSSIQLANWNAMSTIFPVEYELPVYDTGFRWVAGYSPVMWISGYWQGDVYIMFGGNVYMLHQENWATLQVTTSFPFNAPYNLETAHEFFKSLSGTTISIYGEVYK